MGLFGSPSGISFAPGNLPGGSCCHARHILFILEKPRFLRELLLFPPGKCVFTAGECLFTSSLFLPALTAFLPTLFQFLHTEKRFTITEKPFLFFFMLHFFAFYALCGQQNYTRSAKSILPLKNNQRTLPRSWVRPSVHIMPAMQITRGLACHFSRFPPLIDNLSIKLFFVRFCALCGAFCGFWSMPHAIRV